MKVYVDELPKCCSDCPCCNDCMDYGCFCNLDDIHLTYDYFAKKRPANCPLQTISEHDKQVRKEVIKELVDMVGDYWTVPMGKVVDCDGTEIDAFITGADFDEIITRMEKGE